MTPAAMSSAWRVHGAGDGPRDQMLLVDVLIISLCIIVCAIIVFVSGDPQESPHSFIHSF